MTLERCLYGTYDVVDKPISRGGVGSIHRTSDPGYVFKRYFDAGKAPDREHLMSLVLVGREVLVSQAKEPGQTPESSVNWPVDLALDAQGGVRGVVLPIIPQELFHPEHGNVRTLDFLILPRAKPPAARARIVLLLRMAEILAFVHARGLVHGDINGKNLAWTASPEPVMYLIDCDGMVPQEPPPTTGVGAAGWLDPRVLERKIPAHDQYSDWYALALVMYRGLLLTPGNLGRGDDGAWRKPTNIPADLPRPLADLIRRALNDPLDPSTRPAPEDWVDTLVETFIAGHTWNERAIAAVDAASRPAAAPKPKEQPNWRDIPKTDWRTQPPPSQGQPPTRTPPVPPPPPPQPGWTPPRPAPPPRPRPSPPSPPQLRPTPPPPTPLQQWPPRDSGLRRFPRRPTGQLAQTAVEGRPLWYVLGTLGTLFMPYVAVIYSLIALFQLRSADGDYPGVARSRVWLIIFAAVSALSLVIQIVGLATGNQPLGTRVN